ncbi:MAG: ribonuclease III domain-containing protein [bacterium]
MLPPHVEEKKTALIAFLAQLGISSDKIHNTDMLTTAFVHKSYAADFAGAYEHNERLEFLGDSVLGMIVAKHLYNTYPDLSEADLTLYKIALVRAETLAQVAADCGLAEVILIGKGEEKQQGRQKTTILCDCMEAVLGYIYLDCGIDTVENVVQKYIIEKLELIIQ